MCPGVRGDVGDCAGDTTMTHLDLNAADAFAALVPLQFSGDFLTYALVFFVLAIVAALVGFGNVAGVSMEIARILVLLFLVFAVIALIL